MNSKQRRKAKREYPYVIKLYSIRQLNYSNHDKKVYSAAAWCNKNCKGDFICKTHWDHAEFKFNNHKDATIFSLKWV